MNNTFKKNIKAEFSAPAPKSKDKFLKKYHKKEISTKELYLLQLKYIDPLVWIVSIIMFVAVLFIGRYATRSLIWGISAMMPLLALTLLKEIHKSRLCGMSEIESTTRFLLRTVTMVRLGILSAIHFIIIMLVSMIIGNGAIFNAVYLLVPYLITANAGGVLFRVFTNKMSLYVCLIFSVLIGMMGYISDTSTNFGVIFSGNYMIIWLAVLVALIPFSFWNVSKLIKNMEAI